MEKKSRIGMEGIRASGELRSTVLKRMVRVSLPKEKQRLEGSGVKVSRCLEVTYLFHTQGGARAKVLVRNVPDLCREQQGRKGV